MEIRSTTYIPGVRFIDQPWNKTYLGYRGPLLNKMCQSCNEIFIPKKMSPRIKWCPSCRPIEYTKQRKKNYEMYKREVRAKKKAPCLVSKSTPNRKYLIRALNKIIKACELKIKHNPVLDMRTSGMTYSEIGKQIGCTRQNVQQICAQYSD